MTASSAVIGEGDAGTPPTRLRGLTLTVLFTALLVVPGSNAIPFSGLPLSSAGELVVLLMVLPLLFSPSLRSDYADVAGVRGPVTVRVLVLAGVVALLLKVALFTAGTEQGFEACYRSLPPSAGPSCEKSYENALSREGVTRFDRTIDFGPITPPARFVYEGVNDGVQDTNWNLSFLNTLSLNRRPDRDRPPFSARWRGRVDNPGPRQMVVTYVGEGSVRANAEETVLEPAYGSPSSTIVALPRGPLDVAVDYRFDGAKQQAGPPSPPYATMRVTYSDPGHPVAAVRPSPPVRLAGWFVTLAVTAFAGLAVVVHVRRLGRAGRVVLAVAGFAGLALVVPKWFGTYYAIAVVVIAVFVLLAWRHSEGPLVTFGLLSYWSVVLIEVGRALVTNGSLNTVLYRGSGDDFLTYESFARSILDLRSLEAGEKIFVYSPGFRYMLFAAHVVFGDGDGRLSVVGTVALTVSVFLAGGWLLRRGMAVVPAPDEGRAWLGPQVRRRLGVVVSFALVLLLVESAGAFMVRKLMSEYPTWICLFAAFPLLFGHQSRRRWALGVLLLGLAFTVRFDQGPGLLFLYATFLLTRVLLSRRARHRWPTALLLTGLLASLVLLPALHNLRYGDRFVVLPQTPPLDVNFPLPPSKLRHVLSSPEVRGVFRSQLTGVLGTGSFGDNRLAATVFLLNVRALQALYLVCAARAVVWRRSVSPTGKLLLALPLAFLVPHLFIQVYIYYPRHIMTGYLAMGLVAAYSVVSPPRLKHRRAPQPAEAVVVGERSRHGQAASWAG